MCRRLLLPMLILASFCLSAAGEKQETWVEVKSPHFTVVTNSNEKQGRRIADQFERMRSVFHVAFPKMPIDPGAPIIVLAAKDEKDFRALEPEAYLSKGSLQLAGLFQRGPDKNYVLMRVGAEGDHPYAVVYHEYTHLLMSKAAEWMPLWMNEGLAEFYQNTDISEKYASIGQASGVNLALLKQSRLLPLTTLFTVDHNSPYYHEENKGSIFYAESWALVHYIETNNYKHNLQRMTDYSTLLAQKVDPVTAATKVFGDLGKLQGELEAYIRQGSFNYFRMTTTTEVDDSGFKVRPLTEPQSDALRADFLAYEQRIPDSQALLDHVLKADPNNVSAHETEGFLAFRQAHLAEAKQWYAEAVKLDSQSYLAHYYFAAIAMSQTSTDSEKEQIENSFRMAIKLNPSFAPAFDRLAVFLAMNRKNMDEARLMALTAISLEPANIGYRINMANIFITMELGKSAVDVLHVAGKIAKTPQDVAAVEASLARAQEYVEAQARFADQTRQIKEGGGSDSGVTVPSSSPGIPRLKRRDFVAHGPNRSVVGVLRSVHCDNPGLDLTVTAKDKEIALHVDNYFNLSISALGFQSTAEINPCSDLTNRPAKVVYVESINPAVTPEILSIELHK